jgi:hypothetical protein
MALTTKQKVTVGVVIATASGLLVWLVRRARAAPPPPSPGLASLYVTVKDINSKAAIEGIAGDLDGTTRTTDANGAFSILDLQPGTYTLQLSDAQQRYQSGQVQLTFAADEVKVIEIEMTPVTPPSVCQEGETKCVGPDLYICRSGQWQLSKSNATECGYTPPSPPVCQEGETKCVGPDLYVCRSGQWQLSKSNATECGYPPPPLTGTAKIFTGQDLIIFDNCAVTFQGITFTLNNFAGEIRRFTLPPGDYTAIFGEATHPYFQIIPPDPVSRVVYASLETWFFGKYSHVPKASSPCGFAGRVYKVVTTGRKILTNRGVVDETVPQGIAGITVYAWWPAQRDQYGAPRYPGMSGFNPEFAVSTVTDSNGVFEFLNTPLTPDPNTIKYCIGPLGGGERQFKLIQGSVVWINWSS